MSEPGDVAYFGGEFLPLDQARLPITTHAFNYGTGCFEGIRAYWNREQERLYVTRLREHALRILRSARILRLEPDPALTVERFSELVLELLARNGFEQDAYVRPIIYKAGHTIKVTLSGIPAELCMYAIPMGDYLDIHKGLRLATSSWRRIDDIAIPARAKPTGAYLNAALAADEARQQGCDEALMLTADGHVAEASSANLFAVIDGTLVTPPVSDDLLVGVTRDSVIAMARERGWPLEVRQLDRSEVLAADEAFLCGTGVQIAPVVEIDRRPLGDGHPGPITSELQGWYLRVVRGEVPDFAAWRSAVPTTAGATS